ncbi:hypothetical protein KIPB_010561 [Kipferlia bialata]|uniref:DNA-directed RNA polymerase RpoA/D/Rpb3-type domain-containing protein n=1 Tax=Kipferlia bialata TaxID=797122 RepID=A0A9K3GN20_9EUKA|nr:hypothetical protein KIPB_010561 [Kipferlia bialata]|eukprot:g10561.t1
MTDAEYVTIGRVYPSNCATVAQTFAEDFECEVISSTPEKLVVELINVDAPIVNTIRRTILDSVPTMAVDVVVYKENSTILQDEMLAHRLGLIPIHADPTAFEYRENDKSKWTPNNCIVFRLDVTAPEEVEEGAYPWYKVHSSQLEWLPIGDQPTRFPDSIRPVHEDIVIAKLAPGQTIKAELYCSKSCGSDHAKHIPATVYYRYATH